MLDVFITAIVVFGGIGIEGNPVWSWIHPNEVLIAVILICNLLLCLFIVSIIPFIRKRHPVYQTILKYGLIGEGFGRIMFGVLPGILLIVGAGML